jgi:adenosine deaminase
MDYRLNDVDQELYDQLKALPKIELHRHLEGSLRLSTLVDIAREFGLNLPIAGYRIDDLRPLVQITEEDQPDPVVFLSKFHTLRYFYQSPEVIDRIAYEAVADAAAENIIYMELRFTPIALARGMDFPLPDVANWVVSAVRRAEHDFGIDVRLIVSMNRHESVELGEQFVDIAVRLMDRGVVGVDLAGAEDQYPATPFAPVFRKAREAGLAVTIHAGEWAGPENVLEAIDLLGASRIGHGVNVIQDSKIVQKAREERIAFEVCLTSNYQSGVIHSLSHHPLRDMYQVGLLTTINTDDPSVSAINLTDEYIMATHHLGFTLDDLRQHIVNAAESAFLPEDEREKLIERVMEKLFPGAKKAKKKAAAKPK